MTEHIYRLIMTISVTDDDERQPGVNVASAVGTLIEEDMNVWLLEAIGHPTSVDYKVEVESFGD